MLKVVKDVWEGNKKKKKKETIKVMLEEKRIFLRSDFLVLLTQRQSAAIDQGNACGLLVEVKRGCNDDKKES